jgi:hypothetical protein
VSQPDLTESNLTQPNLSDLIRSSFPDRPCEKDPACLFANGHTCDCTTVEIGKHVAQLLDRNMAEAYRSRLQTILQATRAKWLEELVEEGTSPLLYVGWVSTQGLSGYKAKRAKTWHRDRYCKRNKAMGYPTPVLRLEMGGDLTACPGCGQLTDEEKARIRADNLKLRIRRLELTEGICWNRDYANCGADVEPGWTVCQKHEKSVTVECRDGRHEECGKVVKVNTRTDGSTWTTDCLCIRCTHLKQAG